MRQITDTIMMVRPASFGYNEETAKNNSFQSNSRNEESSSIKEQAQMEFDRMVKTLEDHKVQVVVIEDSATPVKPDAIFPNNWISFHEDGRIITYPMYAENRRIERREDIVEKMEELKGFNRRYSLEQYEAENVFLEGTGSMILDRENKIVYACLSQRTDIKLLDKFSVLVGYKMVAFTSVDRQGDPIYHTNVMMALGEDFCVLVCDSIKDPEELSKVKESLKSTGKEIIDITYEQMESFAGNMLQVRGTDGQSHLVMSQTAYDSLDKSQIEKIESFTHPLPIDINTIEYYGGGSVRCMMAEVFVPQ